MPAARASSYTLLAALSCSCTTAPEPPPPPSLPLTDTLQLQPIVTPLAEPQYPALIDPEVQRTLLLKGYGDWEEAPGERPIDKLGQHKPPTRGPNARRLLRFSHLTDLNIVDDESPARAVNADQPTTFSNAYRPNESELCHMANAMVRTLNEVHAAAPLEFVLLGGNLIDNAQQNELDWALAILGGAEQVECDSADDTVLDPDREDGKDPFAAPGLEMPFYWVTGNHDVLMQGALPPVGPYAAFAVGETPGPGFALRDFSQPGGLPSMGATTADPERAFLTRETLMQRVAAHDDGHGLSEQQVQSGKAFYSFDVHDTPLRFVVLDTVAESGSTEGLLRQADVDSYVRPLLDRARDDGKQVILASHHRVASLGDGSNFNGNVQMDALTPDAWRAILGEYPNILFALAGHERSDHVAELTLPDGHTLWELTSAAFGSYPHQARIIEVWDEGNGFYSLEAIYVDMDMRGDTVAEQGRHLGLMDYASGWNPQFSTGLTSQRNVRVYAQAPPK
jgi:hypothetical protein